MSNSFSDLRAGAPTPVQKPFQDTHHGVTRTDEFAWLRDDNWQAVMKQPSALDGDIRAHLEAENQYTDKVMAPTTALQESLFSEMRGRILEDEASVPVPQGELAWATRYVSGGEHPLICCGPREAQVEDMQVLIDGNQQAQGKDFFKITHHDPDPKGPLLAWAYDDKGSEYFTICIRRIADGTDLPDRLLDTGGSFGWSACGSYLFYIAVDENHRPNRVLRHALGSAQADDVCVYEEKDPGFFVGLSATTSGRFLIISAHDHETAEAHLLDAHAPLDAPTCVAPRETGIEYDVDDDAARDRLLIVTNWNGDNKAEDFQIVSAPIVKSNSDKAL